MALSEQKFTRNYGLKIIIDCNLPCVIAKGCLTAGVATIIKVEPNRVNWVVTFVLKRNYILPGDIWKDQ